jgi:hypothetical protein
LGEMARQPGHLDRRWNRRFESHRGHGYLSVECRVLSGGGLSDELITRPEKSYRLCCVVVCDLETSRIGAPYIYDINNLRVKDKVFSTPVPDITNLKARITDAFATITEDMLGNT